MNIFKYLLVKIQRRNPLKYSRDLGVIIGDNCRLMGIPLWDSEPYLITIGDNVTVSSHVRFVTHDGGTWVFRSHPKYKNVIKYGKINIGNNCFIGTDSIIMPGVAIGDNCVIAAGSIVTKSVPHGSVWGGVPAKFICTVEQYAEKCLEKTPQYNVENYNRNKREELLRVLK